MGGLCFFVWYFRSLFRSNVVRIVLQCFTAQQSIPRMDENVSCQLTYNTEELCSFCRGWHRWQVDEASAKQPNRLGITSTPR